MAIAIPTMEFHEVANIFPLIEGQEFADLVEDIRTNGLQQSIWTYQDKIVDGRNRYRACMAAGVEPRYQEWDGNGSLMSFTVSMNIRRRHLDSNQRAMIAARSLPLYEAEAKERMSLGGQGIKKVLDPGTSVGLAAKDFGTNAQYVGQAKNIRENAPGLEEHVFNGTLSVSDADAISKLPEEHQSTIVEEATKKKKSTGKRASKVVKDAVKKVKTEIKREQAAEEIKTVTLPKSIRIISADFRLSDEIADESVDLIFTDPPYHEEHLALWSDLAVFAARVLKPGGILLAYSGQIFLPQVLNSLSEHLTYCWLLSVQHTGGHIQIWKHTVWNDWKPLVMFSKGNPVKHEWLMDLYRGDKGDKDAHEWSQGEGEAAYFIEKLTKPSQLIVDPMCGSGTILRAAHKLQRNSLGLEIDGDRYTTALASMKDLVSV